MKLFWLVGIIIIIVVVILIVYVSTEAYRTINGSTPHFRKNPEMYNGLSLNDDYFPSIPKYKKQYEEIVSNGYKRMKSYVTILFTGIVRDNANDIEVNLSRMNWIGKTYFKDYLIVLFENDSSDGTREIIKKSKAKIDLIECPEIQDCKLKELKAVDHGGISRKRFEKMAEFRNRVTDYFAEKYADKFDYVMVFDWDVKGPISVDGLASCFGYTDWDMMASNGLLGNPLDVSGTKLMMTDPLAFVPYGKAMKSKSFIHLVWDYFTKNTKFYRGQPPFRVNSAFNACAIYRMKVFSDGGCRYSGEYCEHIMLHKQMIERGYDKLYLNPSFILLHSNVAAIF